MNRFFEIHTTKTYRSSYCVPAASAHQSQTSGHLPACKHQRPNSVISHSRHPLHHQENCKNLLSRKGSTSPSEMQHILATGETAATSSPGSLSWQSVPSPRRTSIPLDTLSSCLPLIFLRFHPHTATCFLFPTQAPIATLRPKSFCCSLWKSDFKCKSPI